MTVPSFADLPLEVAILPHCDPRSLLALEQTCRTVLAASHGSQTDAWRQVTVRRWGPDVRLPADGPPDDGARWRALLRRLEMRALPRLRESAKSAKRAIADLEADGVLPAGECAWQGMVRRLLEWAPLDAKRRLVAFVCADWQPRGTLAAFLRPMPIVGETPLAALRTVLLRFPFLPIDAGVGADHVLGSFARAYAVQNPAGVGAAFGLAPASLSSAASLKRDRDAVYTLTYSLIMLNTDLHHPAISPKISPSEYVTSCRRCAPLASLADEGLLGFYADVARRPLTIAPLETRGAVAAALPSRIPPGPLLDAAAPRRRAAPPSIDWAVAYWNLVDLGRHLRSTSARAARSHAWPLGAAAALLVAAAAWHLGRGGV